MVAPVDIAERVWRKEFVRVDFKEPIKWANGALMPIYFDSGALAYEPEDRDLDFIIIRRQTGD